MLGERPSRWIATPLSPAPAQRGIQISYPHPLRGLGCCSREAGVASSRPGLPAWTSPRRPSPGPMRTKFILSEVEGTSASPPSTTSGKPQPQDPLGGRSRRGGSLAVDHACRSSFPCRDRHPEVCFAVFPIRLSGSRSGGDQRTSAHRHSPPQLEAPDNDARP